MKKLSSPHFKKRIIEEKRKDGYWVEAIKMKNNQKSYLIGFGINSGQVSLYQLETMKKINIAKYDSPVGMDHGDVNGNGKQDIVICYQFGESPLKCDPQGGKIQWLQNPGDIDGKWKNHYIGRATATRRLKIGYFTQQTKLQLIGLPIVGQPNNLESDVPIVLFTKPQDPQKTECWPSQIINRQFHMIHDFCWGKYHKFFGLNSQSNLDSVILASAQGLNWLYYDTDQSIWQSKYIGPGQLSQVSKTGYKGCANVASGRIGQDKCAYLAAIGPFHGNTVMVYYKNKLKKQGGWEWEWQQKILDVYGDTNENGQGTGHHIICADFDGDGDDEFLIALRGPYPWQGVFMYKAIDIEQGLFVKWRVSEQSAARISIADFGLDGRIGFATMGYSVQKFYECQNCSLNVFENDYTPKIDY